MKDYGISKRMYIFISFITLVILIIGLSLSELHTSPVDNVTNKYTSVGNISLTVTNFGVIGKAYCPPQPSCMYPKNSGIENIWLGGLWVGGIKDGQVHVTTGAVDVSNPSIQQEGFEFSNAPGSGITERSTNVNSQYYSPNAISPQDFVCEYYDINTTGLVEHTPLGIKVLMQSYAYDLNYANYFVILNYKILNIGYNGNTSAIDSLYVGMWTDFVVRNINITNGCNPGTSFFSKNAHGYIDTMNMEYAYDHSGDTGYTNNYAAIKLLGIKPKPTASTLRSKWTVWNYKGIDPIYFCPTTDYQRYSKMQGFLAPSIAMDTNRLNYLSHFPSNRITLISYGPFKYNNGTRVTLRYQLDTINAVFAVICAKKTGNEPSYLDSYYQKTELFNNAKYVQRVYENNYILPSVGINSNESTIDSYRLEQNFPNPFNPKTSIQYSIKEYGLVSLKVYNVLGEEIETLINQNLHPGIYSLDWDASRFSSGLYFYRIITKDFTETKSMILLK